MTSSTVHDGTRDRRLSEASRGQLLIIIALLLATIFVALAVVVNSGIYTENLGTRENTDPETIGIEQAAIDDGVLEAVNEANGNVESASYSGVISEFDAILAAYNRSLEAAFGTRGSYVTVTKTGDREGVRLRQTNESRNFTSAEGAWNYSLTNGTVDEAGHFTMNLQEGSIYEMTLDTTLSALAKSAFGIEFNLTNYTGSGDGVWRVYFFEGAVTDTIYAIVEHPTETFRGNTTAAITDGYLSQACAVQGDSVSVRLNQSTYGGRYCEEFSFYGEDGIGEHSIRFVNARSEFNPDTVLDDPSLIVDDDSPTDRARGSYDVMLGTAEPNETAFHGPGAGEPWHQAAIYRVDYDIVYRSSGTTYTVDERRAYPTRSDPGGVIRQHPIVDRFDVTDRTDDVGSPTFEVDWAVSDVDRELDRVELQMVHVATDNVSDRENISVSNGSAGGTTTLDNSLGLGVTGDDYRVQITVVDESGRATTRSEVHEAGT